MMKLKLKEGQKIIINDKQYFSCEICSLESQIILYFRGEEMPCFFNSLYIRDQLKPNKNFTQYEIENIFQDGLLKKFLEFGWGDQNPLRKLRIGTQFGYPIRNNMGHVILFQVIQTKPTVRYLIATLNAY